MAGNRAAAEKFILKFIDDLAPGNPNVMEYQERFKNMSDAQFDVWMKQLEEKGALNFVSENDTKFPLEVSRNIEIAKKFGHSYFERIWFPAKDGLPPYLSPKKAMIGKIIYRRQAQLLEKKISIPENNKTVDNMTGQPTGKSKGASISYPEAQVLEALNLENNLIEFMKMRGGDTKGFNAMNDSISKTGGVSLQAIAPMAGGVKSTELLHAILTSMHFRSTLLQKA